MTFPLSVRNGTPDGCFLRRPPFEVCGRRCRSDYIDPESWKIIDNSAIQSGIMREEGLP